MSWSCIRVSTSEERSIGEDVEAVEGRTLLVRFPNTDTRLRLAADSDALEPLRFATGARAVLLDGDELVVVDGEARR